MKIPSKQERRDFFRSLYEESKHKNAALYDRFDRAMRQYEGDSEIDNSTERASAVRNITYELIESQVSIEIPQPKAQAARYTEKNDRAARAIERLCLRVRDELPFEKLNDLDERYTYIFGGSVWLVEWDEGIRRRHSTGGIRLSCIDPRDFVPEYGVSEVEDMEYCFLRFRTTKSELCRRFGITEEEAEQAEEPEGEKDEGGALVVVAFYRTEDGGVGRFVYSGDVTLSDLPDFYARKTEHCTKCSKERSECLCQAPHFKTEEAWEEELNAPIRMEDGRVIPALSPETDENGNLTGKMRRTKLPYYTPRRFPIVVRRSISVPGELFGRSDCDAIRPQQQQINKLETRILQKLMRSGVTPMLPDDAEITLNNTVFGQLIRLKPGDDRGQYGVLDTTPSIAQEIEQGARLYDQAKRILGITDSFLGIGDNTALSGVAKQVQVEQAAGRLQSKKRMKQAAYAEIDRLIFEYHLAYADENRPLTYHDAEGKLHAAVFCRYDFLEYDPEHGGYGWDDEFLFSVDQNGGIEQQRDVMWQKNLENLQAGTFGNPSLPGTLLHYWQCQERVHYPYARENVEYFRRLAQAQPQSIPPQQQNKEQSTWQP